MNFIKGIIAVSIVFVFIILFLVLDIAGIFYSQEKKKFFKPRDQNIERQVFENTKSYVHGKTQDLARYFEQYQKAETQEDKEAIKSIISIQFADFNEEQMRSKKLKMFLVSMRGY